MSMYRQEYGYSTYDKLPHVYSGATQSEYIQFTAYMFNSRLMYTDTQINQNLNAGNSVLAVLNQGIGVGHSVVLQGYNSSIGHYTYYDPMNPSSGQQTGVFGDFKLNHFMAVGSSGTTFH